LPGRFKERKAVKKGKKKKRPTPQSNVISQRQDKREERRKKGGTHLQLKKSAGKNKGMAGKCKGERELSTHCSWNGKIGGATMKYNNLSINLRKLGRKEAMEGVQMSDRR